MVPLGDPGYGDAFKYIDKIALFPLADSGEIGKGRNISKFTFL